MTENFNYAKRNRKRFYLLSGICFCPCGRRLYGVCCNGYLYYRCTGTHRIGPAAPTCQEKGVWISKLESAVWSRITEALKNPRLIFEQMEAIGQTKGKQQATKAVTHKDTERQLQKTVTAEGRLLDAYSAGAIGIERLRMQMEKIQKTKSDLEGLISKAKEPHPSPTIHKPSVTEYCRKIAGGLSILAKDPPKQQEFLRSIMDKILVQPGQATIFGAIPSMPQEADEFRISAPSP